jgi:type I restriction enzyme S subunit
MSSNFDRQEIDWMGGQPPLTWNVFKLKHVLKEEKKDIGGNAPAGAISFGEVVLKDFNNEETLGTYRAVRPGQFLINPLNLNYDLKSLRIGLSRSVSGIDL